MTGVLHAGHLDRPEHPDLRRVQVVSLVLLRFRRGAFVDGTFALVSGRLYRRWGRCRSVAGTAVFLSLRYVRGAATVPSPLLLTAVTAATWC
ncbi:hypothetical protein ACIQMR_36005 [Streptomyces sp. NPDC091376]|uniref:hypothetical protein n=1 Tax=Streptomyces sp. NPDC091376 TaxID=3365994 RepID=UPI00380419CD